MGVSEHPLQWSQSGVLLGLQGGEELSAPGRGPHLLLILQFFRVGEF